MTSMKQSSHSKTTNRLLLMEFHLLFSNFLNESQLKFFLICLNKALNDACFCSYHLENWCYFNNFQKWRQTKNLKHKTNQSITLLLVEYKILSKILTTPLNKFINYFISSMQIGFIRGTLIYDNVIILDSILKKTKKYKNNFYWLWKSLSLNFTQVNCHPSFLTILIFLKNSKSLFWIFSLVLVLAWTPKQTFSQFYVVSNNVIQ